MMSLQAEHFGILVVITLLDIVTLIHENKMIGKHQHYTDSKSVIVRLKDFGYKTDKQYDSTDYDVWTSTEYAIQLAGLVKMDLHHVKGHQREEMHEERGEQGPLTRTVYYNDWCDKEAEVERKEHLLPAQICYMDPPASAYLKTATTLITASSYKAIYDMKTIPVTEEYMCRKLGLLREVYTSINWKAMGTYFNTLQYPKRSR